MGKVLVIKNADFYDNRVDTVTIEADIACTGITLDQESATVTESATLTATVTPADTTDSIIWSSSDTGVATVSNGVVTAVSNGTATITATCGNYSATCVITVAIPIAIAKGNAIMVGTQSGVLTSAAECSTASMSIGYGCANGTYPVASSKYTGDVTGIYPITIPDGATTIAVETSSNYATLIVYYDKGTPYLPLNTEWEVATVLDGETATGGTDWSISTWEYGNKTFTISDVSGVDSFTLMVHAKNMTAYDSFTAEDLTYSFGYE